MTPRVATADNARGRSIIGGATSLLASRAFNIVAQLLATGLLVRRLSPDAFGLWTVISSAVVILANLDMGMGTGLKNRLAADNNVGDTADDRQLYTSVFGSLGLVAVISLVALTPIMYAVPWQRLLPTTDPGLQVTLPTLVGGIFAIMLFNLPLNLYAVVFQAYSETHLYGAIQAVQSVALLLVVAATPPGVRADLLMLGYFAVYPLTAMVGTVWLFRRREWSFRLPPLRVQLSVSRSLLGVSTRFWLGGQFAGLLVSSGPLIVARMVSISAAGEFGLIQRLFLALSLVQYSLLTPLWVAYTSAAKSGDLTWIRRNLARSVKFTLALYSIGGLVFLTWQEPILRLWTSEAIGSTFVVPFLWVWFTLFAFANAYSVLLSALDEADVVLKATAVSLLVGVGLSVLMGRYAGYVGVLTGSTIGQALLLAMMFRAIEPALRRVRSRGV